MKYVSNYRCMLCDETFDKNDDIMTCPHCGEKGILDIEYDYQSMRKVVNKNYFKQNNDPSLWRYSPMMSVDENFIGNTLEVGNTPLYETNHLHEMIGIKSLTIKDEGLNPTGSLKDRASAVAVVKAMEKNQPIIACSSTGNAASSLAGNAARMGIDTVIFVPERAPQGKLTQLLVYGAKVISVQGDYKQTFELSKAAIERYGWYNRNAAINPHLVEGKKTVALEIAEQLDFDLPDWVVVSVGDGCTIAGVYKGFYDLKQLNLIHRIPKLLGVQSEGCDPFVKAHETQSELEETDEHTLADSIAVGIPRNPTKALRAVKASQGTWISVSDASILEAMKILGTYEGIFAEPASAAGLAGLIKACTSKLIQAEDTVTLIHTGNGLKDPQNASKAVSKPIMLKPNLEALNHYFDTIKE